MKKEETSVEWYTRFLREQVIQPPLREPQKPPQTPVEAFQKQPTEQLKRDTNRALLTLWDKAVGTPDYNKTEWKRLNALIDEMGRKIT